MIRLPIESIRAKASERPEGYFEDVVSFAVDAGDGWIDLLDEDFQKLHRKYEPSAAMTFLHSMADWAAHGFKVVSDPELDARKQSCEACQNWNADGYAGTGECKVCGCSRVKLYLAAQRCPIGKW